MMHARDFTPGPIEAAAIARHKALRQKLHPAKPPPVLAVVPKETPFVKIKITDPFVQPVIIQPLVIEDAAPVIPPFVVSIRKRFVASRRACKALRPCKLLARQKWHRGRFQDRLKFAALIPVATVYSLKPKDELFIGCVSRPSVRQIEAQVLTQYPGITAEMVRGGRRTRDLIPARQHVLYEVHRQRRDLSYPAIGRLFGGRDHTTILHSVRMHKKRHGIVDNALKML